MDKAVTIPAIIAVPIMALYVGAYSLSYENVSITVRDKNTVFEHDGGPTDGRTDQNWLVYTDKGVFKVTWSLTSGSFNPAERYHALKVGQTYTVRVAGWRVPEFNWYREIVGIEDQP